MADKAKTETKIFQVACSPQVHDTKQHTNGMMYDVLIALVPVVAMGCWCLEWRH